MFVRHFLRVLICLLHVTLVLSEINPCRDLQPCGDRGECVNLDFAKENDIFSTKCHCRSNYTGDWCQFVDGKYQASSKDVPGIPSLITNTSIVSYDLHYNLTFKGVSNPGSGPVLYYLVRYNDCGEWRSKGIPVNEKNQVYTIPFDNLDWDNDYQIEIYAANKHGLGPPLKTIIHRPKVSIPRIVNVSDDLTGSSAICCKMSIMISCKAQSNPYPKYSWYLNGKPLDTNSDSVTTTDGHLNISNPTAKSHQGTYRCLATNAWGTTMSRPIVVEFSADRLFTHKENFWYGPLVKQGVILGESFDLPCPEHHPFQAEHIKWSVITHANSVEHFPVSERVWVTSRGSLYFSYLIQQDIDFINDHGGIQCYLWGTKDPKMSVGASNLFTLVKIGVQKVQTSLAFHEKPKNVTVHHGRRASFFCSATSSSKTIIQWTKENQRDFLKNNGKYEILDYGRRLQIKNVTPDDAGSYTCVISAEKNEENMSHRAKRAASENATTATASLNVLKPIEIKHRLISGLSLYRETSLTLTCGNDKKEEIVRWFHNGKQLEESATLMNGIINERILYSNHKGRLSIPNVQHYVSGVYQCDVELEGGVETMAEYFYVRGFDYTDPLNNVRKRSNEVVLREESMATLTCLPEPFHTFPILWKNIPEVKTSHFREMENGFLEIHGVSKSDTMSLSCVIPSDKSVSITRNIHLNVVNTVNGGWSDWSFWSSCRDAKAGCREGASKRIRTCTNPTPKYGGKYCAGSNYEISQNCIHGLGMENGEITDDQLSSFHGSGHVFLPSLDGFIQNGHAEYARFNGRRAWCGSSGLPSHEKNYLQINFGRVVKITGLATQGMENHKWLHVKSYTLRFSLDGIRWFDYSTPNKLWEGNTDVGAVTRKHTFKNPIYASNLRIFAAAFQYVPCLRIEVYGCGLLRTDKVVQRREYVKEPQRSRSSIVHDGKWSAWGRWTECMLPADQACGKKQRIRYRECMGLRDLTGIRNIRLECPGKNFTIASCGEPVKCPEWSTWSDWESCKSPFRGCTRRSQVRSRTCQTSVTQHAKKYCQGVSRQERKCDVAHRCRVDGGWSPWSMWSSCSPTCNNSAEVGSGEKYRTRACRNPAPQYGGKTCTGGWTAITECTTNLKCKIHGGWSLWSSWTTCSATCDKGVRSRARKCTNPVPQNGGFQCEGNDLVTESCPLKMCPVNGGWSSWSKWSSCSATCSTGQKIRTRACTNPLPQYGGTECRGGSKITAECNTIPCKESRRWRKVSSGCYSMTRTLNSDGPQLERCMEKCNSMKNCVKFVHFVGKWCYLLGENHAILRLSRCRSQRVIYEYIDRCAKANGQSCGPNSKCELRGSKFVCVCNGGYKLKGESCEDIDECEEGNTKCSENRVCSNTIGSYTCICPKGFTDQNTSSSQCQAIVDGGWSSWSQWTPCSASCDSGRKSRARKCSNPKPQYGGMNCKGRSFMIAQCITVPCKVDGSWSSWSNWDSCTVTCGSGTRSRTRDCTNPAPQHGGMDCEGGSMMSLECKNVPCKVDGSWSSWSNWGSCTVSCGSGTRSRTRHCTNPAPQHGGMDCGGESMTSLECKNVPCEGHGAWSSWSVWTRCSALGCGPGVRIRKRTCSNPAHEGKKCHGKSVIKVKCSTIDCKGEVEEQQNTLEETSSVNVPMITAAAGSAVIFLIALICCCWLVYRKKSKKDEHYKALADNKGDTAEKKPLLENEGWTPDSVATDTSFAWPPPPGPGEVQAFPSAKSEVLPPPPPLRLPIRPATEDPSGKNRHIPSNPQLPPTTSDATDQLVGLGKTVLQSDSGKVMGVQKQKTTKKKKGPSASPASPGPPPVPGPPPPNDGTYNGAPSLPPAPPPSPSSRPLPPPRSAGASMPTGGHMISSAESTYGGLIGFENAILEPGGEDIYIKQARIKKISSKSRKTKKG